MVAGSTKITEARCLIVSKIGAPVSEPALVNVQLAMRDNLPFEKLKRPMEDLVADHFSRISELIDNLVAGEIDVF
jgi:S-adenosylmethionine synthetase